VVPNALAIHVCAAEGAKVFHETAAVAVAKTGMTAGYGSMRDDDIGPRPVASDHNIGAVDEIEGILIVQASKAQEG
jgi:hypothetical protein